MATTIQIKRSSGNTGPTADQLAVGEMAYAQDSANSGADAKLYIESVASDNVTPVVHAVGGYHYTKQIDDATSAATPNTLVERDGTGAFAGDLTGNASTATAFAAPQVINFDDTGPGDVSGTISFDGTSVVNAVLSVSGAEASELSGDVKADDGTVVLENGADGTDATIIADVLANDGTVVLSNGTDGTDATLAADVTGNVTGDVTGDIYSQDGLVKVLENSADGSNATFTGDVTGNAATATDADGLSSAVTIDVTGDVTGSATFQDAGDTAALNLELPTIYSDAASVGSNGEVPVLTIDDHGRITGATTAAITTSFNIDDGSGGTPDQVNGGETLTFLGTAGEIETSTADNQVQIGLPTNVNVGGTLGVGGKLTVTGDLEVNGALTTVNSTDLEVTDGLIRLGKGNTADSLDLGFVSQFNDGAAKYSGFFRDTDDDKYHLFETEEDLATAQAVNKGDLSYVVSTLVANLEGDVYAPNGSKVLENGTDGTDASYTGSLTGGRVHGLSQAIDVADGGTGATSHTANAVLFGNGTGAIQSATGTNGDVMFLDPTTGVPTFGALDGGTF